MKKNSLFVDLWISGSVGLCQGQKNITSKDTECEELQRFEG